MPSPLRGPWTGDVKPAPGEKDNANGNSFEVSQLNQPADGDCIKPAFYATSEGLKGSPAALATPHGTATETLGKTPNFSK